MTHAAHRGTGVSGPSNEKVCACESGLAPARPVNLLFPPFRSEVSQYLRVGGDALRARRRRRPVPPERRLLRSVFVHPSSLVAASAPLAAGHPSLVVSSGSEA